LSIAPYVEAPFYTRAQGRTPITSALWEETGGFVILYLIIFITGSLLLTLTAQCGVMEAMFEFASALGTVGLSIGVTGPTTCNSALLVETVGMLLGRLEIYIVLIALTSFRYK
jgi:trk system potassium uptake protein TrkH